MTKNTLISRKSFSYESNRQLKKEEGKELRQGRKGETGLQQTEVHLIFPGLCLSAIQRSAPLLLEDKSDSASRD